MKIRFHNQNDAVIRYKNTHDAGFDITANEDVVIGPLETRIIKTGLTIEVPVGYMLMIAPKSRYNFIVFNGIVDPGYQGEIYVRIFNNNKVNLVIKTGDMICQGIFVKIAHPELVYTALLELTAIPTERGKSGGIVDAYKKKETCKRCGVELEDGRCPRCFEYYPTLCAFCGEIVQDETYTFDNFVFCSRKCLTKYKELAVSEE